MMELKVTISKRAESNLKSITEYIELNWSIRAKNKFLENLLKKIDKLSKMAEMDEALDTKNSIRRCVVTRQTIMYYRVKKGEIEIITFQDARQDPKKRKL